jgi:hypothetical protein
VRLEPPPPPAFRFRPLGGGACRLASLFLPLAAAAGRPSAEAPPASSAEDSSTPPPPFSSSFGLDARGEGAPSFFPSRARCFSRFLSLCAEATMADVLPPEVCETQNKGSRSRRGERERECGIFGDASCR